MIFRMFVRYVLLSFFLIGIRAESSTTEVEQYDWSVRPGDDFFQFVNGRWIEENDIPESENQWGSIFTLMHETSLQLKNILDDLTENGTSESTEPRGSNRRQLADLYLSSLDEKQIESVGLQPLSETLNRLEQVDSKYDLLLFVLNEYKEINNGIIFKLDVVADEKNSSVNMATWKQSGVELPERSFYFENSQRSKSVRSKYIDYIYRLLQLTDSLINRTTTLDDAEDVFTLELQLAASHRSAAELRNVEENYHLFTIKQLDKLMPNLRWPLVKDTLNITQDTFNLNQPDYYSLLDKLFVSQPLHVWKNKVRYSIVHHMANYLNQDCVQARFQMFEHLFEGREQPEPRWKKLISFINENIGEMLGEIYVERFFHPTAKERALKLAQTIVDTFSIRIQNNRWMTEKTKEIAVKKLKNMNLKVAYPSKWKTYEDIQIDRWSYFNSVTSIFKSKFLKKIDDLRHPPNRDQWYAAPQIVNAYYDTSFNEMIFPCGLLQQPFFSQDASDAANYAAVGFVFGHELVHAFDDQGRKYDEFGNLNPWWSDEDTHRFQNLTNRLVEQYEKYRLLNVSINGRLTLGENIADLGGIEIAYAAFLRTKEAIENKSINGFNAKQRFFLSFARSWRVKTTDSYALVLLSIDPHAPINFRVNGPLSNMNDFHHEFHVNRENLLFREPSERIQIW